MVSLSLGKRLLICATTLLLFGCAVGSSNGVNDDMCIQTTISINEQFT